MAAAVAHYGPVALAGDVQFPTKTSPRDLVAAADQVESTYLIRMWAELTCDPRTVAISPGTPMTCSGGPHPDPESWCDVGVPAEIEP